MNHIFVFCGPIGSGKSSVSKLFAAKSGATWNGFGRTTRDIAEERGHGTDRKQLQELGALLVGNEPEFFCRRVIRPALENPQTPGVIDGLRHGSILTQIQKLVTPRQTVLVFVDAPINVRRERIKARDGLSPEQLGELDKHSTEIEVDQHLRNVAHFIADNTLSVEECVTNIESWASKIGLRG